MKARSLVAFTVLGQTAVGLFWAQAMAGWAVSGGDAWLRGPLLLAGALMLAAGLAALLHLGTPRNAWRALGNLRTSWLSREVALGGAFIVGWAVTVLARGARSPALAAGASVLTALAGAGLVYAMARVYRLRTVPAWDTRLTTASFFLTAASSGALAAAFALGSATSSTGGTQAAGVVRALVAVGVVALAVELGAEAAWRARRRAAHELVDAGLNPHADSDRVARWRVGLLGAGLLSSALLWLGAAGVAPVSVSRAGVTLAFLIVIAAGVVGRDRFYANYARRGL
jgi:anaerobic dimethyl sulfoxide reductase subunit C (anchor subunit)